MSPQIEKQQFLNQSGGWLGVVVIGPKGDEQGISVEPGMTVWLSEPEQILTANAPRSPEDNPFIEQVRQARDQETDALVEIKVTPLVPVSENRYVPANARPIPSDLTPAGDNAVAAQAATAEQPSQPTTLEAGALERHAEVSAMGDTAQPHQQPPVPRMAAKAAAAADDEAASSELESIDGAPPASEPPTPPAPAGVPTPPGAEAAPGSAPEAPVSGEETAAQVNPAVGEETGAAAPPSGAAPEGEFAALEEVGTPDAPAAAQESAPPPYSPPEE
jgi:hypothetical protein